MFYRSAYLSICGTCSLVSEKTLYFEFGTITFQRVFIHFIYFLVLYIKLQYLKRTYVLLRYVRHEKTNQCRCRLFPFRKWSLPFLTVGAIIGNQAFSHGMYNKATNTFLNRLRKNKVSAQLNLRLNFWKGLKGHLL